VSVSGDRVFGLDWPSAAPVRGALERALGLTTLARKYRRRPAGIADEAFLAWTLSELDIEVRVSDADLARVPATGPVIVVANHPFGAIEGIALAHALLRVRADVKILANFLLGRIPELRRFFLLVDPFARSGSRAANARSLRDALSFLRGGGLLVVFPGGEVASLDRRTLRVADPAWSPTIAGLARRVGAVTVPVFVPGRNRAYFQAAGLIHPLLRTVLLARALLARGGKSLELRIGTQVPAVHLQEFESDAAAIAYLRDRTEILAERGASAVQPRRTPSSALPVVPPVPGAKLAAEIGALPADALLTASDEFEVYVARPAAIPYVLREIGRLREITFRDVGEGTEREIDLDVFDDTYLHLFIWDRARHQVVGAYRLGPTDEIVPASGVAGLYTASLFRYDPKLFDAMGPALEMGRSFIRTEHQKSYTGLMLLWKGIGEYVGRHPRYATLFGPVSISADYRSLSQRMIVAFLERNRKLTGWAEWVRPTNPFREKRRPGAPRGPAQLKDLEEVSTFISEIEADQKGVPILLKQYLRLDGRLLGYNVDPAFASVLDVLIAVDLRVSPAKALNRYMGAKNLERFRAFHEKGTLPFSAQNSSG
jgi:putative hemolysin